jgi:hypothetical protein
MVIYFDAQNERQYHFAPLSTRLFPQKVFKIFASILVVPQKIISCIV